MKIGIVVHGRFHAFDLARALLERGHEVIIFTNYPAWVVEKFGFPADRVRGLVLHGIVSRISVQVRSWTGWSWERWTHPMFARQVARRLEKEPWDVIHVWSGVAEEILNRAALSTSVRLVMRGSAHIRTQARLLAEEQERVGCAVDHPNRWIIEREEREYELSDRTIVLSSYAFDSFVAEGFPRNRLRLLPLGAESRTFRPSPEVVEARRSRILSGAPLHVLYVGGISWQKGLAEMRKIVEPSAECFHFRFVGEVAHEARSAVDSMQGKAVFTGKKPQSQLPAEYAWADLFLFPTIQDGFAVVLAHASSSALPILTTTNCSGRDIVHEGKTGWILPIRDAKAFLERLEWCDSHREELAEMVTAAYLEFRTRDWSDVAEDFERICQAVVDEHSEARRS